jgi:hypothetical protein
MAVEAQFAPASNSWKSNGRNFAYIKGGMLERGYLYAVNFCTVNIKIQKRLATQKAKNPAPHVRFKIDRMPHVLNPAG